MGLFYTNVQTTVRPNINIRFKELQEPLKNIEEAIIKSNDKLIESQKDKFIEIDGFFIKASLIEALTGIEDNKFVIIFTTTARTDAITYKGETRLLTRKIYNRVAKEINVKLSFPVCACGETTESLNNMFAARFRSYNLPNNLIDYCPDCRMDFLLKEELFRLDYDINNDLKYLKFLDDQILEINRNAPFMVLPKGRL